MIKISLSVAIVLLNLHWFAEKSDYLPEMMGSNIFQESLSKLPRLQALCERLKTKPVQDPLAVDEIDVVR